MALIQSTAIPSGATDYEIEQSLRLNDDNVQTLSFTPATNGTSTDVFTVAFWCKRGKLGEAQYLWDIDETTIAFDSNDHLIGNLRGTESGNYFWNTNAKFRDTSAWLHIVAAYDSTQSTDTNRFKLYINGVLQVAADFSSISYMPQNREMKDTQTHYIGWEGSVYAFEGYFADYYMIDGQQLTAADFGETGDYGEWKPIEYSGTYGNNGFYLPFNTTQGIIAATGGTITTAGDYKIHTFTSSGTFTPTTVPTSAAYVQYLVVAGGGAAGRGYHWGGGGGAGGMREGYLEVSAQGYSITVGAGGVFGTNGGQGGNSIFSSITSTGGGAGQSGHEQGGQTATTGGSGGGAVGTGAAGIAGQGFAGGTGTGGLNPHGGGGGGASEAGSTDAIMDGGDGRESSISGSSVVYAGGGAGRREDQANGTGGTGGGGSAANGTDGLGGGGGSASGNTNGGSGVVIIKYRYQ